MEALIILIRHIPFWAIPILLICGEFSYVYWVRDKREIAKILIGIGGFCFLWLVYYYWCGGPEPAVDKLVNALRYLEAY